MIFSETELRGAFLVELEKRSDERGYFARSWCAREFAEHGLESRVVQSNVSGNRVPGTVRGMHYQLPPHAEAKLVRCIRGAIFDVIVDIRPASESFLKWFAVQIDAVTGTMLYIPPGFAHGFQTLEPDTEVFYLMSEFYAPESSRGLRWNDPLLGISWPLPVAVISDKDRGYADCTPDELRREGIGP